MNEEENENLIRHQRRKPSGQEGHPDLKRTRRGPQSKRVDVDQLPPHSIEAEAGVLACCLLSPLDALNACEEMGVRHHWFYDLRHQHVWKIFMALHAKGEAVDLITVVEKLRAAKSLEEAGGTAYVAALPEQAPSAQNLPAYLEIVHDKFLARSMLWVCSENISLTVAEEIPPKDLLAAFEAKVVKLSESGGAPTEQKLRALLIQVMQDMDDYHRGRAQIHGLTTGLEYVDKMLCGIGGDNGNYIVLSGRPGTGKTSLAMQIATHAACDYVWFDPVLHLTAEGYKPVIETIEGKERYKCNRIVGVPVGIFSLEMAARALTQRTLFQRAGADMQRWRTGYAENSAMPQLTKAMGELHKPENIIIDDEGRVGIEQLRAKARRWVRQFGIKLLVIDYIQLLRAGGRFRDDRVQELSEISGEIQALGKELQIPILTLAQMNRDYEKEPTREPRLSDLKDCGSIEQDADIVGFLYRVKLKEEKLEEFHAGMEKRYGEDWRKDWSKKIVRVNLGVAKNRYGPTGNCELVFEMSCTRYHDYGRWLKACGQRDLAQGESLV